MKSRDTLIRLKRFQLEEKRRRVRQIEMMLAEFTRMIGDLDREIANEEKRAGIADPRHFAYPTYARADVGQARQPEELDRRARRSDRGSEGRAGGSRGRAPEVRDARSARQDERSPGRSRRAGLRRGLSGRDDAALTAGASDASRDPVSRRMAQPPLGRRQPSSRRSTVAALRRERRCSKAVRARGSGSHSLGKTAAARRFGRQTSSSARGGRSHADRSCRPKRTRLKRASRRPRRPSRNSSALGAEVAVEHGAGVKAGVPGRRLSVGRRAARRRRTRRSARIVVLKVRRPSAQRDRALSSAARSSSPPWTLMAIATRSRRWRRPASSAFAMELMPRITRAQVMDVLSSQANLAGYRAVIDAAAEYGRAMPMMMTPAGTVPAARLFVMGVGVAGLQAIATARRLGAIVTATDVRPATKEQVESLGAKFVAVEDEEFKQAETAGGYAKEMSDAYKAKQAALVASHIAKQDIVVTTALIPGRPAPRLISADMVKSMRAGLGHRRPRRRARRKLRAAEAGRTGDHRQRRQDRRLFQRHPPRRDRLRALRAQSLRLRRDADRQGERSRSRSTGTTSSSRRRA